MPKARKNQPVNLKEQLPLAALALFAILFFALLFSTVLYTFTGSGIDTPIPDQAMWLMAKGMAPFSTIMGVNKFGNHFTVVEILLVPLYWLGANFKTLLFVQTLSLTAAAFVIYFICKRLMPDAQWVGTVVAVSYFLYPATQYLGMEGYHPDTFIVLFTLLAFYFALSKEWKFYAVSVALALATKEDYALSVAFLGIYVFFFMKERKMGALTFACAIAWLVFVLQVAFPAINGVGYTFGADAHQVFGPLGTTAGQAVYTAVTRPDLVAGVLNTPVNQQYVYNLLAPVGFIPVLSPATLLISASWWLNTITGWTYAHYINYHYTGTIIASVFISAAMVLSYSRKWKIAFYALLAIFMASSVAGNYYISPISISSIDNLHSTLSALPSRLAPTDGDYLNSHLPPNASVSAYYTQLAYLDHRQEIYIYPSPFQTTNYGGIPYSPTMEADYIVMPQDQVDIDPRLMFLLNSSIIQTYNVTPEFVVFKTVDPSAEENSMATYQACQTTGNDSCYEGLAIQYHSPYVCILMHTVAGQQDCLYKSTH